VQIKIENILEARRVRRDFVNLIVCIPNNLWRSFGIKKRSKYGGKRNKE
jgi:hypothetical protein